MACVKEVIKMRRVNRLMILEDKITKLDRDKLIAELKELSNKVKKLEDKKREIEKPFLDKIEELKRQIEQLEREMDDAVLHVAHEIRKLCEKAEDIKRKLRERDRLLNEKNYLKFLQQIKKLLDDGWIIYKIDMAKNHYEHYEYELGETIGVSANWNTPSKIMDIKLAEKTFKIKSEIAKNYRSLSLGGFSYPRYCEVILVTGIKPKKPPYSRKSIICPNCKPKPIHGGVAKVQPYAHAEKRCPICDEQYYYVCESCGKVFYPEPQCEHKNIIKEDGIEKKTLYWEEEYNESKKVDEIFKHDYD